ncbi:28739_t:CDS:1, partial [Dentiscutata erythropus]
VQVPEGAKCFSVTYSLNGHTNKSNQQIVVTTGGLFFFDESVPVQTTLSYKIIAYSGNLNRGANPNNPSDNFCEGDCVSIAANL